MYELIGQCLCTYLCVGVFGGACVWMNICIVVCMCMYVCGGLHVCMWGHVCGVYLFVRMFMWVHVCMCDYEHVILVEAGMFVLQYLEGACEYMSVFVCVFEHVSSSLMCVCLCQISCDFVQLISIPLFQCINLYVYVTVPF